MKANFNLSPDDWTIEAISPGFVGVPNACFGAIRLKNTSNKKLKVNQLDCASTCGALHSMRVGLGVRVPAQTHLDCEAQLVLPPDASPGDYEGEIKHAGQSYKFPICILEDETLRFEPRRVYVKGAVGETRTARVQVIHQGNIPVALNEKALMWLEARDWAGHTAVASLRSADPSGDYRQFLDHLFKNFKGSMLPPISVAFERENSVNELMPGSTEWLTLTFTLPTGMEKGKTYHGFIKMNRFRIWFSIYCTGVSHASKRRN